MGSGSEPEPFSFARYQVSTRLQVKFTKVEADALARLAASQLRDPRDQIRLIVRRELQRLGLLPPSDQPDSHTTTQNKEVPPP